jgi:nitric oxide reductase activation protein
MIVISDGEPHHGGTEYVGEVAEKMTARAIQALKQKIKLFAISIDQRGRNYLKDIYGSDNYIVLDNPKDITNKLIYLVKNIAAALC